MQSSEFIVSHLASLMWSEPHEDYLQGMTAIGLVVRNRVIAGWSNWVGAIEKHNQWADTPYERKLGDTQDVLFLRVLNIAQSIYSGLEKDITYGALWYCRLYQASNTFIEKIVRNSEHPKTAQIGLTTFFK